jgi:hypothetical protein
MKTNYEVTVQFKTEDEESGKVKSVKETYLIMDCYSVEAATNAVSNFLSDTAGEWSIKALKESRINEIIDVNVKP